MYIRSKFESTLFPQRGEMKFGKEVNIGYVNARARAYPTKVQIDLPLCAG